MNTKLRTAVPPATTPVDPASAECVEVPETALAEDVELSAAPLVVAKAVELPVAEAVLAAALRLADALPLSTPAVMVAVRAVIS